MAMGHWESRDVKRSLETVLTPGKYLKLHKVESKGTEERKTPSDLKGLDRRRLAEETTGQREAGCAAQTAERKGHPGRKSTIKNATMGWSR